MWRAAGLFFAAALPQSILTTPVVYRNSSNGFENACIAFKDTLKLEATNVLNTAYVPANTTLTFPFPADSCPASLSMSANMCRVELRVNTSSESQVDMEAWLPDEFYGRLLGTGNGGLNGCPQHGAMDTGAAMHFAAVGTNNGHNGNTGAPFLNHPEVIKDFAYRAIEVEATLGKQIVEAYYGNGTLGKSYFSACSTGGRQGFRAAQDFPDLFDGIVAGSPALNWNYLLGYSGIVVNALAKIPLSATDIVLVTRDVLAQCDAIDGVVDNIIDIPARCDYRPENLLCNSTAGNSTATACLTQEKVDFIHLLFSPVYGTEGQLLTYGLDPGATGSLGAAASNGSENGGAFFLDWYRYAIFNDTSFTGANFTIRDMEFAQSIDPSGISTINTDLRPFRNRGGKLLSYHGTQDQLVPLSNSLHYYNDVAQELGTPTLDDFYRLFQIPGMQHCRNGPGAWQFGQSGTSLDGIKNDSSSNILLALVDWVEKGIAPDTIIGTKFVNDTVASGVAKQRTYCPYPLHSVLKEGASAVEATSWECV